MRRRVVEIESGKTAGPAARVYADPERIFDSDAAKRHPVGVMVGMWRKVTMTVAMIITMAVLAYMLGAADSCTRQINSTEGTIRRQGTGVRSPSRTTSGRHSAPPWRAASRPTAGQSARDQARPRTGWKKFPADVKEPPTWWPRPSRSAAGVLPRAVKRSEAVTTRSRPETPAKDRHRGRSSAQQPDDVEGLGGARRRPDMAMVIAVNQGLPPSCWSVIPSRSRVQPQARSSRGMKLGGASN